MEKMKKTKKILSKVLAVIGIFAILASCFSVYSFASGAVGDDSPGGVSQQYYRSITPSTLVIDYVDASYVDVDSLLYTSSYPVRPVDSRNTLTWLEFLPSLTSGGLIPFDFESSVIGSGDSYNVVNTFTPVKNEYTGVSSARLLFENVVLNKKLMQGSIAFNGYKLVHSPVTAFYQYYGYIAYPRKDGNLEKVLFYYNNYVDYDADDYNYIRFSYYPSINGKGGNPTKLNVYEYAYQYAHNEDELIPPENLKDSPVFFYSCEFYVDFETNLVGYINTEPTSVVLTDYCTIEGTCRVGESFDSIFDNVSFQPDINEFNFSDFITDGLLAFLDIELFPGFKLYMPLALVIVLACIMWIFKAFAGG